MNRRNAITIKRAYDPPAAGDGARLLVDRLWPRGLTRKAARIDAWLKDIAPSAGLRRWFGHDPERWHEFVRRYYAELDAHPDAWRPVLARARRERITLVYAARDPEHNHARALLGYLKRRGARRPTRSAVKQRGASPRTRRSTRR